MYMTQPCAEGHTDTPLKEVSRQPSTRQSSTRTIIRFHWQCCKYLQCCKYFQRCKYLQSRMYLQCCRYLQRCKYLQHYTSSPGCHKSWGSYNSGACNDSGIQQQVQEHGGAVQGAGDQVHPNCGRVSWGLAQGCPRAI